MALDRLDDKCEGCEYDGKDAGYFCICCVLMKEYTPHKKENEDGKKAKD